ncbi:MAG: RNase adapter RapZ [Deltaproteobacteria bacterium]|nr:MAG: RNase adapter RapZ [Deltaproteobacteria bacterium]
MGENLPGLFNVDKKNITIISGLSGSGKSTAIAAFEDAGFYCVDNMPVSLLPQFIDLPLYHSPDIPGFVFGMDLRDKEFILKYQKVVQKLNSDGYKLRILFLEANDEILRRRYSQTRRHHPLSSHKTIMDGIRDERNQLKILRKQAHKIIDTSALNVHELKSIIFKYVRENITINTMQTHIMSFGFKQGIPNDSDLIIDVRFLKNPYFIPELKPYDGENKAVQDFVLNTEEAETFLKKYMDLLDYLLPLYEKEGKAYLTIAFGCTGGRHRSVAIAKKVYEHLSLQGKQVAITHRDKGE